MSKPTPEEKAIARAKYLKAEAKRQATRQKQQERVRDRQARQRADKRMRDEQARTIERGGITGLLWGKLW